jgi:methyl-accepting chemotaxis protein
MFNNLTIKNRLISVIGLLIAIMGVISYIGQRNTGQAIDSLKTVYIDRVEPLRDLKVVADMYAVNIVDTAHKTRNRNLTWTQGLQNIEQAEITISQAWKKYTSTYITGEEKKLVDAAIPLLHKAEQSVATLKGIMQRQDAEALTAFTINELYPVIDPISDQVSKLVSLQVEVAKIEYDTASANNAQGRTIALTLIALGVLSSLFAGFYLIKAITKPIDTVYNYLNRMSVGDIGFEIENTRKDEISKILDAAQLMQRTLKNIISEMDHMSAEHERGDIDVFIDTGKFHGAYETMALGINKMVADHITVKKKAIACVKAFGEGDFEAPLEQFPGKKAFVNETIEQVRTHLKLLIEDAYLLAAQAQEGNLSIRADANRHQGDFRKIIAGINFTLDAIVVPLQETIEQIKNYSHGDMSGKLIAEYKGDFAELKKRLNYLAMTMKGVIDSCAYVKSEHDLGNIDVEIAAERFKGDFGLMASNINELVKSHINLQNRVVEIVQHYANGDFSVTMDRLPGKKGQITAAVDGVKNNLESIQSEISVLAISAQAGQLSARANANKFEHAFKDMVLGINATLDAVVNPLNVAAHYVERIAHGDIPAKITDHYPGDFNTIKNNLNTCIDAVNNLIADANILSEAALDGRIQTRADASKHEGDFRKIVEGVNATLETIVTPIITVKSAVDSISTAAKEISAGNADLSHRTEQQAASLEQTASSMEQLASTVKLNADNARHANQMVLTASEVASKGGSVVQQVVDTMVSINESARKIVDIISVIDGIALQTNILALNAAVEAARAGEQGRGFAVVASEVRNLAQRSAEAAKEIKALISDSVEKVEDGSKLVGEAGRTMDDIVNSVRQVTDIMADIASASAEQSSGIEQVNQAVNQMDEVTQQNAALVEEAAAAAESLEEQAETLAQTVAQFRLDSDIRTYPQQSRRTMLSVVPNKPTFKLAASQTKPSKPHNDEWEEF